MMKVPTPLDALITVSIRMGRYEDKYGMKTDVFFDKYNNGEMGDDADMMEWANDYRDFLYLYVEVKNLWDASEKSSESQNEGSDPT